MQNVIAFRLVGIGLAGLLTVAAALSQTALFQAPSPGSNLRAGGGAELVIDLVQGQEALLWSSLSGNVTGYTVLGWPSRVAGHDLGGALMIDKPENGLAGVIDFGEKPMSASFDLSG
ncbi:MAG: hypothetical protein O7B77_00610 [Actinobacteria bacterium]|nr:hypothetical protein [Actinomycetota bacterium]